MWMMMDSSNELKQPADPMMGRKLRPLMPRPSSSSSSNTPYSTSSCCGCIRNPKILSWNHSISDHHYGVKRSEMQPLVSTRWNPTPEQLQALEEMYRRGIRTPSAEQIQQIAAKLGRFGKIEGKNVFYWFQNHKARERQKKRRQLEMLAGKKQTADLGRRYFEIEHHKKASIASNCSTPSEDSASMHAAAIAPDQCGKDGWPQFHHNTFATVDNDTCCQLDFSSCLPFSFTTTPSVITHNPSTGQENTSPYCPPTRDDDNENEHKESHTLQLFPTASYAHTSSDDVRVSVVTKTAPSEFIEFLPIKN